MKLITVYNNFANTGGAQDVALTLAEGFAGNATPVVLTRTSTANITREYAGRADFLPLSFGGVKNLFRRYPDAVFLSHDRKSTTRLMAYRLLLGESLKIVHVAHNVFDSLRWCTWLPKHVVAISSGVRENLVSYFRIPESRISFIPNGIADLGARPPRQTDGIRILLLGRICKVKRQVDIARRLAGKLPAGTSLCFAGRGELERELADSIATERNMQYLGQIDVAKEIHNFDYVMLCSEREGLPLCLIEACMYGKPMVTNALPSVTDINIDGITGYVCRDDSMLADVVSHLPSPASNEYKKMSDNARRHFDRHFQYSSMIESYRDLLERL